MSPCASMLYSLWFQKVEFKACGRCIGGTRSASSLVLTHVLRCWRCVLCAFAHALGALLSLSPPLPSHSPPLPPPSIHLSPGGRHPALGTYPSRHRHCQPSFRAAVCGVALVPLSCAGIATTRVSFSMCVCVCVCVCTGVSRSGCGRVGGVMEV